MLEWEGSRAAGGSEKMGRHVSLCGRAIVAVGLLLVACGGALLAQTVPPAAAPAASSGAQAAAAPQASSNGGCIEPEPLLSADEYSGPFRKSVLYISRKLERRTAHRPHARPATTLCSLNARKKFTLFVQDTVEPVTFVVSGFYAALSQAQNSDARFGQGGQGFGKRYGAALADEASGNFFGVFFYPALFHEDPRYFRMAHGSSGKRFVHALRHTIVARSDTGHPMFNFSEWLGNASAVSLGNLYHPDNRRGFAPAARSTAIYVGIDLGFDVLREFLPEISRKLKLPFIRPEETPAQADAHAAAH